MSDPNLVRDYKSINRKFFLAAVGTMVAYGGILAFCSFVLHFDQQRLTVTGDIVFKFGFVAWGLGFMGAYFVRMERKTDMSIKLGSQSIDVLFDVQAKLDPLIADIRTVVTEVKDVVKDFHAKSYDGIRDSLNEITADGTLKRALREFETVPALLKELVKAMDIHKGARPAAEVESEFERRGPCQQSTPATIAGRPPIPVSH
jgi:hypothetical protein